MAWGLDDLRKLVNGLADTFNGGSGAPIQNVGMQNIQDAIVKPGRLLSDFSGVTQGVKGVDPKASNMDRGLALLTLAGMLGGQEAAMGLKSAIAPKYSYGLHISPNSGLKEINATPEMARYYDDIAGTNYFFDTKKINKSTIKEMEKYLAYNINNRTGVPGVSVYQTKTPIQGVKLDPNIEDIFGRLTDKRPSMPDKVKDAASIWNDGSIMKFKSQDRGARYTANPLQVLNEFRIGRNFPVVPGEDSFIRSADTWKREDFVKALQKINKNQPRLLKNKNNIDWIKNQSEDYKTWWSTLDDDIKKEMIQQKRLEFNDKIKKVPILKNKKTTP